MGRGKCPQRGVMDTRGGSDNAVLCSPGVAYLTGFPYIMHTWGGIGCCESWGAFDGDCIFLTRMLPCVYNYRKIFFEFLWLNESNRYYHVGQ